MVKSFLLNITKHVRKFSKLSSRDESRLKELNCPVIPIIVKPPKVITWSRPGDGCFKLNVDSGSDGNPGSFGAGGILRDARGHALAGFAHSYGVTTNSIVEVLALFDGLRMVQQRGLQNLLVQSDSKVVVGWLNSGICNLWYMWDFWEEILYLFRALNCRIHHIYREANMVANFLAKESANSRIMDFDRDDIGIGRLGGLLRTDYLEMPYLRR
ncbi:hypothetical protein LWI29_034921 [Acer saccharum]|uniref:RNase H type-1 domain-containing protein n=1 Tax=Acer saccharum TaxID=4024 RepID=A0AA39S726_ACESA|nr:hypothetical protein LWI29_034921 [Acer saccharum]